MCIVCFYFKFFLISLSNIMALSAQNLMTSSSIGFVELVFPNWKSLCSSNGAHMPAHQSCGWKRKKQQQLLQGELGSMSMKMRQETEYSVCR